MSVIRKCVKGLLVTVVDAERRREHVLVVALVVEHVVVEHFKKHLL